MKILFENIYMNETQDDNELINNGLKDEGRKIGLPNASSDEDVVQCAQKIDVEIFNELLQEVSLFVDIHPKAEVSLILVDDAEIRNLNNEYRGIDNATDVLSFPLGEPIMLGDVAISADTTHRQATDAEIIFERELAFLFIHGVLHLLGYDHELGEDEEREMFALQEDILRSWASKYEHKYISE